MLLSTLPLTTWYQQRKLAHANLSLRAQSEAAREILLTGSDADTVEQAVVTIAARAPSSTAPWKSSPPPRSSPPTTVPRCGIGLVVRLREQNISLERLKLERARFELDVADLCMKHLHKLKMSGVLEIEDRGEAVKKIRETMFGQYTKDQLEAAALSVS